MRPSRTRLSAGALRKLPCRAPCRLQLQAPRLLPELRGTAYGESAALLVDEVFPEQPMRQWVLSFPYPLRFLFASRPALMG